MSAQSQTDMAKKSRLSKAEEQNVNRVRNLILIALALIVGGVIGYGVLYSTGVTDQLSSDGYEEGTHYELIEDVEPRRPGAPVVVAEYFSYGCIHCKNFDPQIQAFKKTLPAGSEVQQMPVTFSANWALLAQAFLALESIDGLASNHQRLFSAIHDSARQFTSAEQIADFVAGRDGVSKEAFLTAFNSASVRRKLARIDASMRAVKVASVPALIVDGRYRINMSVGRKQALEVARYLVDKELGATANPTDA